MELLLFDTEMIEKNAYGEGSRDNSMAPPLLNVPRMKKSLLLALSCLVGSGMSANAIEITVNDNTATHTSVTFSWAGDGSFESVKSLETSAEVVFGQLFSATLFSFSLTALPGNDQFSLQLTPTPDSFIAGTTTEPLYGTLSFTVGTR